VTEAAYEISNENLDRQNKKILWETYGKGFYYLTDKGRSVTNSPFSVADIFSMLYEPDYSQYTMR
jgi:4-hydroxyacetophenone monooxygenase